MLSRGQRSGTRIHPRHALRSLPTPVYWRRGSQPPRTRARQHNVQLMTQENFSSQMRQLMVPMRSTRSLPATRADVQQRQPHVRRHTDKGARDHRCITSTVSTRHMALTA